MKLIRLRDLLLGLRDLGLGQAPVLVHASLSAFGQVEGGAPTVVTALKNTFHTILAPAFTYKTMVIPLVGPPDNGLIYGSGKDQNRMAEFFRPKMPVDPLIGIIPETLRRLPEAQRSHHPILSFTGLNAERFLNTQTLQEPFAPIGALAQADGWVILMGVNHTVNTSIHYAERLAGRKTFIRWALTPQGVVECPNFPGCSAGFQEIAPNVERYTRFIRIGNALLQALPLQMLLRAVVNRLHRDPLALLCRNEMCERCQAVRADVLKRSKPS
ncbi:MAG: AAC(3) family N-acetyltransferase [Anaerolineales bacterium]|nr:AAC(3) family N-acetyltransferase [Anaerolineales bacterium]MDW8226797.1 AAC(3) family N-acetyltransferase [Anaerolineales bacterium]